MIEIVITNYFVKYLDPPEPLELSLEPDLGYPPPDPPFKTTVIHTFHPFLLFTLSRNQYIHTFTYSTPLHVPKFWDQIPSTDFRRRRRPFLPFTTEVIPQRLSTNVQVHQNLVKKQVLNLFAFFPPFPVESPQRTSLLLFWILGRILMDFL